MPLPRLTIDAFERFSFGFDDVSRTVFRRGSGPAVILLHELPGITPEAIAMAARFVSAGFTVMMPSLFGAPGKRLTAGYLLREFGRCCLSREFSVLATRKSSPLADWLRGLCRHAHAECGGPGVGVVGMCVTGGLVLSMMADESVMAPVMSQPSLPLPLSQRHCEALGVSDQDLQQARRRANSGCPLLGLRFSADRMCPAERFKRLQRELGDAFEWYEIDSSPGNPHGLTRSAHCVLTVHLVDREGHPTHAAVARVIEFIQQQLLEK